MILTLDLPPELEKRLHEAAVRSGQAPEAFATAALASTLREALAGDAPTRDPAHAGKGASANGVAPLGNGKPPLTLEEFDAALDELAAIGGGVPLQDESITHSREDIYCDHD